MSEEQGPAGREDAALFLSRKEDSSSPPGLNMDNNDWHIPGPGRCPGEKTREMCIRELPMRHFCTVASAWEDSILGPIRQRKSQDRKSSKVLFSSLLPASKHPFPNRPLPKALAQNDSSLLQSFHSV